MSNGFVTIEGEYGEVPRSTAEEERSMVLCIHCHTVIEATTFYRILADNTIGRWIDLRHFVGGA